jgi:hypothetical protein
VLAAKNITHGKAGCIIAGYLKLLPVRELKYDLFSNNLSNKHKILDVHYDISWNDC